jgi:hypothetical protein
VTPPNQQVEGWVLRMARTAGPALAPVRLVPDIEVAEADDQLWVRGRPAPPELLPHLAALPAEARFDWLASDRLRPVGSRLADQRLPLLRWESLRQWLRPEGGLVAMPGRRPRPVALRWVLGGVEAVPDWLATTVHDLTPFLRTAARLRLERLQFAASPDGRILVRGRPLPAVPGTLAVSHGRIAVPAGHHWEPAVDRAVLERSLNLAANEWAWFRSDGTFVRLNAEQFLPLHPAAWRATLAELGPAS